MAIESEKNIELTINEKDHLIEILTEILPMLRAKIGVSQDELCNIIGISRQTYSAIETQKRKMSWNTFLSLLLFFDCNQNTTAFLNVSGAFPELLKSQLNINNRSMDIKENKYDV